jgi:DNA polymerase-1
MGYCVTCNPSFGKKSLESARRAYPLVQEVIDLKSLRYQLDNFFGPNLERFIVDGRLHPEFDIVGARQTGRFSSRHPNGQNIPARTVLFDETPRKIAVYKMCRECFVPDAGMWLAKMDFAGQENRLIAHFAVGPHRSYIRQKYNENPDFDEHDLVGAESGLYEQYGPKIGRKYIKNYRFGKAYGMQIPTMMEYFGWGEEHAEHMDEVFRMTAPWVGDTMGKVQEIITKRGYVRTIAGRRCHLPLVGGKLVTRHGYKGFNKLIQGSGADLMKKALVNMYEERLNEVFELYLTVHDEIVVGVPKTKKAIALLPRLQACMEHTFPLFVPMRVDPELGKDWGHTKDWKEFLADKKKRRTA